MYLRSHTTYGSFTLVANKAAVIDWFSLKAYFGELSASLIVLIVFL